MKMLLFTMMMSVASAAIYDGQTGSPKVDLLVDNCWTNLTFGIEGKRAMVITTSYGEPLQNGDKTGVCLQEAADPYYIYLDSGADVDIVSIKGGQIPYDTKPKTKNVRRFLDDKSAMSKLNNSTKIDDVNFDDYDLVFMAGGWGAAFDLPTSDILGQKVAKALATGKPMIASTCHGALGFVRANRTDGTPYIKGVKMTGVTDKQIEKLGIEKYTPYHPENALKELGADYQCIHGTSILFGDVAATSTSVGYVYTTNDSGENVTSIIVTGQNQCASCVAAQRQVDFFVGG